MSKNKMGLSDYDDKCVRIILEDGSVVDETGTPMPVIVNRAEIDTLCLSNVRSNGTILKNEGRIGTMNLHDAPPVGD